MNKTITEEGWKVVEGRLETMPKDMRIGILSHTFDKKELIVEVKGRTEVGISYALMQLRFIKWLLGQSKII